MFVPLLINTRTSMMQISVNSGKAGIMFLFLVEATNIRANYGLAGFHKKLRLLL